MVPEPGCLATGSAAGRAWRAAEQPWCFGGVRDTAEWDTAEWTGEIAMLSDEERSEREEALNALLELMRPSVQADGGDLALIEADVETGIIEVQLRGACSSCAISGATLQGGVERILKGRLDWVTEVRGGVDESADPFESAALGQGGYVPRW
jgi:Fe-S cluster biogenesis protein NfuA